MSDALDKIGEELFGTGEAVETEQPNPQPEQVLEPAVQPVVEVQKEPEPVAQPEPQREEHTVPLAKYLDTRDELKELKRWRQEQEAKAASTPKEPGPFDEKEMGVVSAEVAKLRFEMSDELARQAHGAEKVEAAADWALEKAKSDPVFAARYMREKHPIDWIVRQHKQEGLLKELGDDPDEYVRRRAGELGLIAAPAAPPPAAAAPTQQAPRPAAPRPSLITAPSGGGVTEVPTGPLAALEAVFPR